jgi:hypothetical protein
MRNFYLFLIFTHLITFPLSSLAQSIKVNEIMASNSTSVADDDGDFSDWIELYNAGQKTVQLEGWGLSDNYDNPYKWVFPEYSMEPGELLLIWASGKDRRPAPEDWTNGLMREVYPNIPGTSLNDLIYHHSYPENPGSFFFVRDKFEAPIDVADNYGQRMHGLLKAPATGNFVFWISSDDSGQLLISPDENPENLQPIAEVNGWTHSREWHKFQEQKSQPVYLEEGKFYFVMALMKEGTGGDNLAIRWQWPDGTMDEPISAEHLFWPASAPLHTNFSIGTDGEEIILTDLQGKRIDEIPPVEIPTDISYGRTPDGDENLLFFTQPTPGKENNEAGYTGILSPPEFSHSGGFYSSPFQLSLTTDQSDATIVYTLDSSLPTTGNLAATTYRYKNKFREKPESSSVPFLTRSFRSHIYNSPLEIYNRSNEENQISSISTTFHENPWYLPNYPVEKAFVVKARTVKDGALPSETVTHSFFVTENGTNPYILPVISFSTQEDALFDYDKGIYTAGIDFENWRTNNPNGEANGGSPANYHRGSDEWEYPAGLEFFDKQGIKKLGQNIGFRIHGGWSRSAALKSLRIYARKEYGDPQLNHSFFSGEPYDAYKRLILRNSGNDFWYTYFRDAALHEMVKHMNVEIQAYQPSVLFMNGEYWGIHNIRERLDQHYLARKYEIGDDQVDILEGNAWVVEGENNHYVETINYIKQNGTGNEKNYEYIKTRIDTESFIDYMLSEIFMVNTDWPGNNIKYWRYRTNEYLPGAAPGRDGRWRWMIFDTDFGFGIYNANNFTTNMLEFATQENGPGWPNPDWSTFLFRKLLENNQFKNEFINRYCDQLNSALLPEVVQNIFLTMKAAIEPEMEKHIQRWSAPSNTGSWNYFIDVMLNFAENRPNHAREHLRSFFELESDYSLTVDVSNANHGLVKVNTLPIQKETKGIPEQPYPWQGTYFKKLPLRLEALPAEGYEFVRWESASGTFEDKILELEPENDQHFTAIFEKSTHPETLVHYWNFNETEILLNPSFTLLTAAIRPKLPADGDSEITFATRQGFAAENARFGDEAGTHLRVNYPLNVSLTFDVPTTGFSEIKMKYETRRSGQGAGKQIIEFSVNGTAFIPFTELIIKDDDPELVLLDFTEIEAASNNPVFKIRISFEQAEGGTAGNNRFDNVTLEGIPGDDVNLPPIVLTIPEDLFLVEDDEAIIFDLNEIFQDPEDDPLNFTISSTFPQVVETNLAGSLVTLKNITRGETLITLTASDGNNTPIELSFRVLVYPRAFELANSDFNFTFWDDNAPEMTFPEHILFLQSNINDPTDSDPLEYAYYIPENEYSDNDKNNIGFPYRNTSRTRLNGLGTNGISFINTGRGRDLGGMLLALNTMEAEEIQAEWLNETILRNSREYGLKLQFRIGHTGPFYDMEGTEYVAGNDGHSSKTGPVYLPEQLLNREYVQVLWRYHHLSGTSGPRAQLRLDDILVKAKTSPVNAIDLTENINSLEVYPNPFRENFRINLKLNRMEETEIGLYDFSGRKMLTVFKGKAMSGENTYNMNGSHLTPGTYILICRTESEIFRHKIVKQSR